MNNPRLWWHKTRSIPREEPSTECLLLTAQDTQYLAGQQEHFSGSPMIVTGNKESTDCLQNHIITFLSLAFKLSVIFWVT